MTVAFPELATEMLAAGHQVRFSVKGGSMHPTIQNGDHVLIAPCTNAAPRIGEILFCHLPRGLVLHRCVGTVESRYRLLGDGIGSSEELIGRDQILGVAVELSRGGEIQPLSGVGALVAWKVRSLFRAVFRG